MLAIISVDNFSDASVIVVLDEKLREQGIEIVKERNKKFKNEHCYLQQNIKSVGFTDFNNRILKEINYLRQLEANGVHSERITNCLEILRFIRNDELNIDFETGCRQENEWLRDNK